LASYEKLVLKLRQRKQDVSKLRLKAEKQLKASRSIERRSSSGLVFLDKKIESEKEDSSEVSNILTQKTSQLESIHRLVTAAEERLNREKETLTDLEQEMEFAENLEEKQSAETRLNSIKSNIGELEFQIKSRQKTAKKIAEEVATNTEIKSKISSKIKKQSQSKPSLRETMTKSHKAAEKFGNELKKRLNAEEIAKKSLGKAIEKLQELQAKKKKSARKTKTVRKAPKRKAPKRKAPKRKTVARKAPKRKTARKTAA
jgi:histone H1/5